MYQGGKFKLGICSNKSWVQQIATNFSWLLLGEVVSKGLGFLTTVYLARVLGDAGFGKVSFAQAFLAYGVLIADFGLPTYGIREVAKNRERLEELVANIQAVRLIFSIIVFAAATVLALLCLDEVKMRLLFIFSFLYLFPYALGLDWAYKGLERMGYASLWNSLLQLGFLFLIIVFVRSYEDFVYVPLYRMAGLVLASCVLLWTFYKGTRVFRKVRFLSLLSFPLCKTIIRASFPLIASYFMVKIYFNFDIMMLGIIDEPEVVGWYNSAYKVIMLCLGFCYIITSSFSPGLSHSYKSDKKRYMLLSKKLVLLTAVSGAFLSLLLFYFSRNIIGLLYGPMYENAIIPLMILSFVVFLDYVASALGCAYVAAGFERTAFIAVTLGAIANICLNLVLIPQYSLIGAASATSLSYVCILSYYILFSQKTIWRRNVE